MILTLSIRVMLEIIRRLPDCDSTLLSNGDGGYRTNPVAFAMAISSHCLPGLDLFRYFQAIVVVIFGGVTAAGIHERSTFPPTKTGLSK